MDGWMDGWRLEGWMAREEKDAWLEKDGWRGEGWMDGKEKDVWLQEEGKNWMFLSSSTVALTLKTNILS